MKNKIKVFIAGGAAIIAILGLVSPIFASQSNSEPSQRKIVVFKQGVLSESEKDALVDNSGGARIKDLKLINGKAVILSPRAEKALAKRPEVLRIDDDAVVEALVKGGISAKPAPANPAEILPWGVDRIDAEKVWSATTGDPIKVAVLDTGIDIYHPDLKANLKGGFNTINPFKSYNDDNGHGTHVAGIIAAADNEIGVIGVGPKIDLYAVKALDRNGSGYLSDIIEGLDWAIANGMQVVNMSLGTTADVQSFREAVQKANAAGIVQVAAAGNNGVSVIYPAAYSEVIAVSATDKTDVAASWSSRGPEVDLAAPGVSIYSTYKGSTYKTLSGTSMASPHVAGVAALALTTSIGTWDLDGDGVWDPVEVQNKLERTAEDLGAEGRDNLYGAGLVDAEAAVLR
ncbi:MAG: S8 family peptidase [bacterium]|nr:S8 family peptidase [bacterium]